MTSKELEGIRDSLDASGIGKLTNHGDIIFHVRDGREMLRITSGGSFLVEGRQVVTDMEVYRGFKRWLGIELGEEGVELSP